jgi:hypothetical protein
MNDAEVNLHPFQTSSLDENECVSLSLPADAPSPNVKSHQQIFDSMLNLDMVKEIRTPELPEI